MSPSIGGRISQRITYRNLLARINRAVPLPSNESGLSRRVETMDDVRAAVVQVRHGPYEAPAASAVRTVHERIHPVLDPARRRHPPERELRVATLGDAALETQFGIVISAEREVVAESAWDEHQLAASGILQTRRTPRPQRLRGMHGTLISQWCEHYYHWLADALPRYLVLDELGFAGIPLIVPDPLASYQRDSLLLLGATREQLIPAPAEMVAPDTLVWPAQAGTSGHPPAWACRRLGERLRSAVGANSSGPRRRLLISRRGAAHRRVVNETELAEALAAFRFEVVRPELLSFADQIRLFQQAEIVVAPHGAGLANMLFAQDATTVEIHEPDNINPCFYTLSDLAGHRYWYVLGERSTGHTIPANYRDIRAPISEVIATVERIVADDGAGVHD